MELKNLHEVLSDATHENSPRVKDVNTATSVRLGELGPLVNEICQQNGTTISAFLRQCCHTLIREYREG